MPRFGRLFPAFGLWEMTRPRFTFLDRTRLHLADPAGGLCDRRPGRGELLAADGRHTAGPKTEADGEVDRAPRRKHRPFSLLLGDDLTLGDSARIHAPHRARRAAIGLDQPLGLFLREPEDARNLAHALDVRLEAEVEPSRRPDPRWVRGPLVPTVPARIGVGAERALRRPGTARVRKERLRTESRPGRTAGLVARPTSTPIRRKCR